MISFTCKCVYAIVYVCMEDVSHYFLIKEDNFNVC